MGNIRRFKVSLNSVENIEELLQELYNEACENIVSIQNNINKLNSSVSLNEEIMESKTKFAKVINDFIANKDKAIGRKLEIAKLMAEILKYNGNVKKTIEESDEIGDLDVLKELIQKEGVSVNNDDEPLKKTYKIKEPK